MIKRIVQATLGRFGLRLIRTDNAFQQVDGLVPFFLALKGLGFAPRHIIDVGANRGNWARQALRFFPNARYTMVEPQNDLKLHIQDLVKRGHRIEWINVGVSDEAGTLPFTISTRDDSSSFAPSHEEAGWWTANLASKASKRSTCGPEERQMPGSLQSKSHKCWPNRMIERTRVNGSYFP